MNDIPLSPSDAAYRAGMIAGRDETRSIRAWRAEGSITPAPKLAHCPYADSRAMYWIEGYQFGALHPDQVTEGL